MHRRDFVKLGSALAAAAAPITAFSGISKKGKLKNLNGKVKLSWDGLSLTPEEYTTLLMRLADEGKIKADYYSNGGVVEELEHKFASLLGKESAVFMPTGTLANQLAVRQLAGNSKRVIVQEQSHFYNDTGDCAQNLSNLNLIPLGKDKVEFSLEEVKQTVAQTRGGRVKSRLGVIAIETPVRRQSDRISSYENLKQISDYARGEDIKMHLDGARLFVQSAHSGNSPAKYGELFDTVYTSMWKCFNAASGAILAGSNEFTKELFHVRRMFGGGLPFAWPFAAVALHYADTFIDEYKIAYSNAEKVFEKIAMDDRFELQYFENGTHIFKLLVKKTELNTFKASLSKKNIVLPNPVKDGFMIKINPSFNRETPDYIAQSFLETINI
jgi:threonine aldolase